MWETQTISWKFLITQVKQRERNGMMKIFLAGRDARCFLWWSSHLVIALTGEDNKRKCNLNPNMANENSDNKLFCLHRRDRHLIYRAKLISLSFRLTLIISEMAMVNSSRNFSKSNNSG